MTKIIYNLKINNIYRKTKYMQFAMEEHVLHTNAGLRCLINTDVKK